MKGPNRAAAKRAPTIRLQRGGNRRSRWLIFVAALSAASLAGGSAAVGTDSEKLTAEEAAEVIAEVHPDAVASSESGAVDAKSASVDEVAGGFTATGTDAEVTVGAEASDPLSLETKSGPLTITPLTTDGPAATEGEVVHGDSIVYANTAPETDTVVRPTDDGVETFSGMRSDEAPEEFQYKLDLAGDQRMSVAPNGGVLIVDPTPQAEDRVISAPKPADAPAGSPMSDKLKAQDPEGAGAVPDADPAAAQEAEAAIDGVRPASDADVAEAIAENGADGAAGPEALAGDTDLAAPPADAPASPEEAAEAVAAGRDEAERQLEQEAGQKLEERRQEAAREDAQVAADNAENAEPGPMIVAQIEPTWAKDAEGDPVKTSLSVEGDVVTMHVDHRGEDVAYPVVADPWVQVTRSRQVWRAVPIYRTEWYHSGWRIALRHVGNWHNSWCGWAGACRDDGWGWWTVWFMGGQYASPLTVNPWSAGWGGLYEGYWEPTYSQRTVIADWFYHQVWENYTDWEYQDDPSETVEFISEGIELGAPYSGEGEYAWKPNFPKPLFGCRPTHDRERLTVKRQPDYGYIYMDTSFCWNYINAKAVWDANSGLMDIYWNIKDYYSGLGYTIHEFSGKYATQEAWGGHPKGAARMERKFDFKFCPGQVLACTTKSRKSYVTKGHYDKTAVAFGKDRPKKE